MVEKFLTALSKEVESLFNKTDSFLIPDYQRPYSWTEKECETLWNDIVSFVDREKFNFSKDSYFLGSIIIFTNKKGQKEVIDGQQRLTTLILLLRAFYEYLKNADKKVDSEDIDTKKRIERCIWQSKDELGKIPNFSKPRIKSISATDDDIAEFEEILKSGEVKKESESKYALNYSFFLSQIKEFSNSGCKNRIRDFLSTFPVRVMNNCYLLQIESTEEETALMIFSTLNDRGLPLSDTDIFKAQFYKNIDLINYKNCKSKPGFIELWKGLEKQCKDIFQVKSGNPMDELFTRYMYYERARQEIIKNTTEPLRKFYGKDKYNILKQQTILEDLKALVNFWEKVSRQDKNFFSDEALKWLFVLNYAPNSMWTSFVSVYFMANKGKTELFRGEEFSSFLKKNGCHCMGLCYYQTYS